MDLTVDIKELDQCVQMAIKGEIDLYNAKNLKEQFIELVEERTSLNLLLDLREVHYIDSTGLGILIGIKRRITEKGGKIALVLNSDKITKLFTITGLINVFDIFNDIGEAQAVF